LFVSQPEPKNMGASLRDHLASVARLHQPERIGACTQRSTLSPIDVIGRFIDDFQIGSACPN
jgi:hypothetical protein